MQSSLENPQTIALIQEENTSFESTNQDSACLVENNLELEASKHDFQLIWSQVLAHLAKKLKKPSFETWIRPTSLVKIQNDEAVIAVRNEFSRNFILQSYQK